MAYEYTYAWLAHSIGFDMRVEPFETKDAAMEAAIAAVATWGLTHGEHVQVQVLKCWTNEAGEEWDTHETQVTLTQNRLDCKWSAS